MSTLTDRYIWAVIRSVPEPKRADVEKQLRASIADAADARFESGDSPELAERAALTELGDPARVASGFADRALYLIGPRYFVDYQRLLILLTSIVGAVTLLGVGLAGAIAGQSLVGWVVSAIMAAVATVVQVAFWVTLGFAILDRVPDPGRPTLKTWSLARLPALPTGRRVSLVGTGFAIAGLIVFATVIVGQHFANWVVDAVGNAVPLLDPALWALWLPYFFAIIAAEIAFAVALYRAGSWAPRFAWVNVLLNVGFTVPALWLVFTDQLINPAFIAGLQIPADIVAFVAEQPLSAWFAAPFVLIAIIDIADGAWKTRKASRGPLSTADPN